MSVVWAYRNGELIEASRLTVAVTDGGFVQGVTVAEQLRTFGGRLFRLPEHLRRLARSLEIIELSLPEAWWSGLEQAATELARRNHELLAAGDDLGLTIFATPGAYSAMAGAGGRQPLLAMHTFPLQFGLWARKFVEGESLALPEIRQVPTNCWPAELKCRSRMHYYLADRQASRRHPGARAVMLDQAGRVTEATTANLLLYRESEGLVSPPAESILPGISVAVAEELSQGLGIPFTHREVMVDELARADEVLLTSTSVCTLPVVRFEGQPIGTGRPGPVHARLLGAWGERVGVDIAEQARRFANRATSD